MVSWQMGLKVLKEKGRGVFGFVLKRRFVLREFERGKGLFAFAKW